MKNIGGQAVIEGVMMKSQHGWSVAVREPGGGIAFKSIRLGTPNRFLRLPLVRGIVALVQALLIGIKAIEFSGSIAYQEDEKPITPLGMALSLGAAIILSVVLFIILPLYATKLLGVVYRVVETSSIAFNLVDGVLRVGVFLLYVFAIGLWKEMRRIFEYHGAEHKVIYTFEAGEDLTVENARKYLPYHPRCGTSFLLIVMIISIMVFSFIPQAWPFVDKALSRIILIPVIAGISYEILRMTAKFKDNPVMRLATLPGLLLQRLTVREPDGKQIEIAIAALREVLTLEPPGSEVREECLKSCSS